MPGSNLPEFLLSPGASHRVAVPGEVEPCPAPQGDRGCRAVLCCAGVTQCYGEGELGLSPNFARSDELGANEW